MWGIFSICVLSIAGATASSAQPVELQGIMGKTVTFTTAVRNMGTLSYSGTGIGDVTEGEFTASPNEQFTGRLQWDSSTGLFSITGLKVEDKGEYKVEDTQGKVEKLYKLTVYKGNVPVSKPKVSHDKHSCTLYCTVDRGTEVTLSWYREGEEESFVSSDSFNTPYAKLPEAVERSGTYTCEAVNSVSRERSSVTVGEECAVNVRSCSDSWIIGLIVIGMFIIIGAILASVGIMACINPNFNEGLRRLLGGEEDTLEVNNGE